MNDTTYDTDPGELLDFAMTFATLGDTVGRQVYELVDAYQRGHTAELELNGNAVEMARSRLAGKNEALDEAFAEYAEIEARQGFDCDQDDEAL